MTGKHYSFLGSGLIVKLTNTLEIFCKKKYAKQCRLYLSSLLRKPQIAVLEK